MCIKWFSEANKLKQTRVCVVFQIIAFDELRTDFKNPIDQSNPTRAVRTSYTAFKDDQTPQKSPLFQV